MMKKMIVFFIVFLLLLPQFAAAEVLDDELLYNGVLYNGGFEKVTDGAPEGWSGTQNDWGDNSSVAVSKEKVHSGDYAIKIVNGNGTRPWINRQTSKLISGATYKVSFWLCAELGKNADSGVGVYMEFYRGSSASSGSMGTKYIKYAASTNGLWTKVTGEFILPMGATMVKLYCRLYSDGYAYFDDVFLEQSDVEEFSFSTTHVFHYTDDTTGKAAAHIHDFYKDTELTETSRANFYIYDGDKIAETKLNIPFTDGTASFTYSVPDILEKKGTAYRLKIEAVDTTGKILSSYEQNLYKYDRPKYLDKDGTCRDENGKIINPVISFHLSEEHQPLAKEAGFNMFQMSYGAAPVANAEFRDKILNAAEESGLKGIFSLYIGHKAAGHPDNIENTKKIVEMYKDDPRIFAWLVQDEPLGGGITEEKKEWLEMSYKIIRDIDPNHPIILTDHSPYVFHETVKYCDVFIPNSYAVTDTGVKRDTEEAVKYACGRPVIPNIGAYARGTGTEAELPTGDQLKHFAYQAFLGGAKGISVFAFSDTVTNPTKVPIFDTALWEPLCALGQKEIPILFDLFLHNETAPETLETSKYAQRKWTTEEGDFYCLLSLSDSEQKFTYAVGENKNIDILSGDSGESLSLSNGTLSVSLTGSDVLLFKAFEEKDRIRVEKNGIGLRKTEAGLVTVLAPEETDLLITCLYKTMNDKEELIRIEITEENTMPFLIDESETECYIKVYAWGTSLNPKINSLLIPSD